MVFGLKIEFGLKKNRTKLDVVELYSLDYYCIIYRIPLNNAAALLLAVA
jgi:hypothetical protein